MNSRSGSNELQLTRVYDAPVRAVWDAWTISEQVALWWGPRGFTITTQKKDLRIGGSWHYTMHGPDGVDYPNVTRYHEVEPLKKLVYDHGSTGDTPPLFRVTVTFTEAHSKTTMALTMSLASPEAAAQAAKFIKQAGGNATWDRLAEHLESTATGKSSFVINRTFDARVAQVFERWTDPELLAQWLPPAGSNLRFLRSEIAAGKCTFFVIDGSHGKMHVRAEYLVIEPLRRIVYDQQFVDDHEQLAQAPGAPVWPPILRTTVLFVEEALDRTRVTVTTVPNQDATASELTAFSDERAGMTLGWTGSFDKLEALVAPELAA